MATRSCTMYCIWQATWQRLLRALPMMQSMLAACGTSLHASLDTSWDALVPMLGGVMECLSKPPSSACSPPPPSTAVLRERLVHAGQLLAPALHYGCSTLGCHLLHAALRLAAAANAAHAPASSLSAVPGAAPFLHAHSAVRMQCTQQQRRCWVCRRWHRCTWRPPRGTLRWCAWWPAWRLPGAALSLAAAGAPATAPSSSAGRLPPAYSGLSPNSMWYELAGNGLTPLAFLAAIPAALPPLLAHAHILHLPYDVASAVGTLHR